MERAAHRAADAGVADRITLVRHDFAVSFPDGRYDLVSAQYLHSPVAAPGERESILRTAVDAVAPGGTLLIVSHASRRPRRRLGSARRPPRHRVSSGQGYSA